MLPAAKYGLMTEEDTDDLEQLFEDWDIEIVQT